MPSKTNSSKKKLGVKKPADTRFQNEADLRKLRVLHAQLTDAIKDKLHWTTLMPSHETRQLLLDLEKTLVFWQTCVSRRLSGLAAREEDGHWDDYPHRFLELYKAASDSDRGYRLEHLDRLAVRLQAESDTSEPATDPVARERRQKIDTFIQRAEKVSGDKITRKDISDALHYKAMTALLRYQRNDPKSLPSEVVKIESLFNGRVEDFLRSLEAVHKQSPR